MVAGPLPTLGACDHSVPLRADAKRSANGSASSIQLVTACLQLAVAVGIPLCLIALGLRWTVKFLREVVGLTLDLLALEQKVEERRDRRRRGSLR